jgi:hypothetical protein
MKTLIHLAAFLASSAMTLATAQSGDNCSSPIDIAGQGSFSFNTQFATTGTSGQSESLCGPFESTAIRRDIWFAWTANATGTATISTCNSSFDTRIAAYPGSSCPVNGSAIACNDDACGQQSSISFPVGFGVTYMLQVGGSGFFSSGPGSLDVTIDTPFTNGSCVVPATIGGEGSFPFNLNGQTMGLEGQNEVICYDFGTSGIDNDIWFTWVADTTGIAMFSTCSSSIDTKIALYPGTGCPSSGSSIACNDDFCGLQSSISAAVTAGTSYTLQVGNFPGGAPGPGVLDVSMPTLDADDCATPEVIAGEGIFAYDMTFASTGSEGQDEASCYFFGSNSIHYDLWYSWTADSTGVATVSTCALASFDTKIAAYPGVGCPTSGTALACNDDACGTQSEIQFDVVSGVTYTLQIGTFSTEPFGGAAAFLVTIEGPTEPGTAFCFCDAVVAPCNNPGVAGSGCGNLAPLSGATLGGSGNAVVGSDTLVLSATGLTPNNPGLYFQGTAALGGGVGVAFGDGLRCAGGTVERIGVVNSDAGGASSTLGITVSVAGSVSAGELRHYQLWYRNPGQSFCSSQFNLTNGYSVQW